MRTLPTTTARPRSISTSGSSILTRPASSTFSAGGILPRRSSASSRRGQPPYETADQLPPAGVQKGLPGVPQGVLGPHQGKGLGRPDDLLLSDELHDAHDYIRVQMKALCDMIHEVDPKIPIYSPPGSTCPTGTDTSMSGDRPPGPRSRPNRWKDPPVRGRIWFTTDGQMCTDSRTASRRRRLLPHYCFKYGAAAYEFCRVVADLRPLPIRMAQLHPPVVSEPGCGYRVRYPNGDGFPDLSGPPRSAAMLVSSIRLRTPPARESRTTSIRTCPCRGWPHPAMTCPPPGKRWRRQPNWWRYPTPAGATRAGFCPTRSGSLPTNGASRAWRGENLGHHQPLLFSVPPKDNRGTKTAKPELTSFHLPTSDVEYSGLGWCLTASTTGSGPRLSDQPVFKPTTK